MLFGDAEANRTGELAGNAEGVADWARRVEEHILENRGRLALDNEGTALHRVRQVPCRQYAGTHCRTGSRPPPAVGEFLTRRR